MRDLFNRLRYKYKVWKNREKPPPGEQGMLYGLLIFGGLAILAAAGGIYILYLILRWIFG